MQYQSMFSNLNKPEMHLHRKLLGACMKYQLMTAQLSTCISLSQQKLIYIYTLVHLSRHYTCSCRVLTGRMTELATDYVYIASPSRQLVVDSAYNTQQVRRNSQDNCIIILLIHK